MVNRKNPYISDRTVTRRSLLEWMGKGVVLALGGTTLASCLGELGPEDDGGSSWLDGDGGVGGDGQTGEFPFSPGEGTHPVFEGWGERTVDRQDLEQILGNWQLTVDGMVESPRVFSFADLVNLTRTDMLVDFHCVEGWSIYDVPWNGVLLNDIFDTVKPLSGASYVTFHTLGGKYNESLPLDVAKEPKTVLAYGIGGSTIPLKHGFPLRIVIPRLLGYKNAKYIERIELTNEEVHGFWVNAGYPYAGEVPAGRLRPGKY
jgi:DMSO/TMAO reductase YedYZ molybdopterin-dependent catalytic subunit